MLARIYSCAVVGLEGVIVEVETDTNQGFPGMDIVGLPDAAVKGNTPPKIGGCFEGDESVGKACSRRLDLPSIFSVCGE